MPGMNSWNQDFKRAAGVEADPSQEFRSPPARDSLPWACVTCGRWVNPLVRIHTDIGLFHDAVECLTGEQYEALVARYACRCEDLPRVTPEEKREASRIAVALEPGGYDSDDLDRIQAAYEQRMREFEKDWETYP